MLPRTLVRRSVPKSRATYQARSLTYRYFFISRSSLHSRDTSKNHAGVDEEYQRAQLYEASDEIEVTSRRKTADDQWQQEQREKDLKSDMNESEDPQLWNLGAHHRQQFMTDLNESKDPQQWNTSAHLDEHADRNASGESDQHNKQSSTDKTNDEGILQDLEEVAKDTLNSTEEELKDSMTSGSEEADQKRRSQANNISGSDRKSPEPRTNASVS